MKTLKPASEVYGIMCRRSSVGHDELIEEMKNFGYNDEALTSAIKYLLSKELIVEKQHGNNGKKGLLCNAY